MQIADLVERTCTFPQIGNRKSVIGNPLHTSNVRYRSLSAVKSTVATVFARAVQCAGVDDTRAADVLVAGDVGVALEHVVVVLAGEQALLEAVVVAVGDGDLFAVETQAPQRAPAGDADLLGVTLEARPRSQSVLPKTKPPGSPAR